MSAKKCNFHTHSKFCDGKNTAEEMVLAAIEKGFDVLGFSSHCMHPLNPEFYKPFDNIWHIPAENIKAYTQEIHRLKTKSISILALRLIILIQLIMALQFLPGQTTKNSLLII